MPWVALTVIRMEIGRHNFSKQNYLIPLGASYFVQVGWILLFKVDHNVKDFHDITDQITTFVSQIVAGDSLRSPNK